MILHHDAVGSRDAPVLLLGGSLGTSVEMWRHQLLLAEHLRLVRHDHRGHGRSLTPPGPYAIADLGRDVIGLMDALQIERASYCGVSLGAMVGMWLATHAPDRIERLVLICTSAHMPPASRWHDRAESVLGSGGMAGIADAVVDRWLTPAFASRNPHTRDALRSMLLATPTEGYAACCGAIARMDLRDDIRTIVAPTLVISGSDDLAAPIEMQEQLVASIPQARHEIVRPAAHLANVEQPAAVNRLIMEHLG